MHLPSPIFLDEPEFEVHLFPSFLFFFFARASSATCLWLSHPIMGSFVLHSFFFFRMSPSLSLYITPQLRSFFDGADVVFRTTAFATLAAAQGVSAEAPIPSTESVPIGEGTHTEALTPQEGVISPTTAQTEVASPATPLVISTSDPFAALSQAVNDSSSLVVTPSSIPSSTTYRPDADLSSEGSEYVLEDPNDEPTKKKRIFYSNEEESVDSETKHMGMCLFSLFFFAKFLPPSFCYLPFIDTFMSSLCCVLSSFCMPIFPDCRDSGRARSCSRRRDAHSHSPYHTHNTCFYHSHCAIFCCTFSTCFCLSYSPYSHRS